MQLHFRSYIPCLLASVFPVRATDQGNSFIYRRKPHNFHDSRRLLISIAAFVFTLPLFLTNMAALGSTPTVTILHSFTYAAHDGEFPTALIQGSDGNFYGATNSGGPTQRGTAFRMTPAGAVTILHMFGDGTVPNDGAFPNTALIQGSDGNFYGTTSQGGGSGGGTVFKMTPSGTITILLSFAAFAYPYAAVIQGSDGNFYGTTWEGGSVGLGTVFRMTPSGAMTIVHTFAGYPTDGDDPNASLIQSPDGNFYGTTWRGGSTGNGTAFRMTPSGAVTILHSFGDGSVANDGISPLAGLIQGSDGNFYGTTEGGGADGGTAFRMTPSGAVTILHAFTYGSLSDGYGPGRLIQGWDGSFYGTTSYGGPSGLGTVYKLDLGIGGSPPGAPTGLTATVTTSSAVR